MPFGDSSDKSLFEQSIRALEAEIANAGAHMMIDASARQLYARQIAAMADQLRLDAANGRITWAKAAETAQETRNIIMEIMRGRSTPVGRAISEQLKSEGRTLNELVARKASQLYGEGVDFNRLSTQQQNAIYGEIVKSAGKSNPRINAAARHFSTAGRSLLILSVSLSVYTVATSDDKVAAIGREAAYTGAGIGGGLAGGALAGLACGPGAPVCVTVGAFVGGALAAFGVGLF